MDIGAIGSQPLYTPAQTGQIQGTAGAQGVQPRGQEPSEPTPPPGGNVENRQPPAEPTPPAESGRGQTLNITV